MKVKVMTGAGFLVSASGWIGSLQRGAGMADQPDKGSILSEVRYLAFLPLGDEALRLPHLIATGAWSQAILGTLIAGFITVLLVAIYRVAIWLLTCHPFSKRGRDSS